MNHTFDLVDVCHTIEDGMITYKGLPAPVISDYLTREQSRDRYAPGTEFHIGRIDMVANTGTYLDSPFHRYADGCDLADLPLSSVADLPALVLRRPHVTALATTAAHLDGLDVRGKAVLVDTGWDQHWRSSTYGVDHPFLTADAA